MEVNKNYLAICSIKERGNKFEWKLRWKIETPINNTPTISVKLDEIVGAIKLFITSRDNLHDQILELWKSISAPPFCRQQEFLCKCLSSLPKEYLEHIIEKPVMN